MFRWASTRANEDGQNMEPTFRVQSKHPAQSKKTAPSPLGVNINHTNQNGMLRPPQTITYVSPTSAEDRNGNYFETRDVQPQMQESSARYVSMDDEREAPATSYQDISNQSLARLEKLDPSHPMVSGRSRTSQRAPALDLKHNDDSFQIVASLIVDRFEDHLSNRETKSIRITAGDTYHMERVVPDKKQFIDAVKYRIQNCPENSSKQIHKVTRQCHVLGLDRKGESNLLFAPIGSHFELTVSLVTVSIEG